MTDCRPTPTLGAPLSTNEVNARLRPFQNEIEPESARVFWQTWGLVAVAVILGVLIDNVLFRVATALVLGACVARLFVIFHDVEHGAIYRRQPFKRAVMRGFGYLMLSPPAVWKKSHSDHHRQMGCWDLEVEGEFPVWTTERYQNASTVERFVYRTIRHPLTIFFAYFTVFMLSSCAASFIRNPVRHWRGGISLAAHFGVAAILVAIGGWSLALALLIGPAFLAAAIGIYLIYVQHNKPGVSYASAEERDTVGAATHSTTYFKMGPIMNWITANIGYHNVHHMAPRIPFYRLPQAMAALPELIPHFVETSWRLSDIRAALQANLYDPARRCMVAYKAARSAAQAL